MIVTFDAKIKEVGNPHVLNPIFICYDHYTTTADLIRLWGLEDDDVESYSLTKTIEYF